MRVSSWVVLLVWFGAAASWAQPISYGFSAGAVSGAFSYDGDTAESSVQLALVGYGLTTPLDVSGSGAAEFGVDTSGQPVLRLGGGAPQSGWPGLHDAFPITGFEPALLELWGDAVFDGANLRGGLSLADFSRARLIVQLFLIDLSASPYIFGCAEGTPLPDCPESSYPYRDAFTAQLTLDELHPIAEPSEAWLALLAATIFVTHRNAERLF